jgi:hypothetical protein
VEWSANAIVWVESVTESPVTRCGVCAPDRGASLDNTVGCAVDNAQQS